MTRSFSRFAVDAVCVAALVFLAAGKTVRAQERAAAGESLVEVERAFSRLAGKIGYIPAFLAYFADDVFTFGPAPSAGKDRLRDAAARMPMPPSVKADWEPWFADTAGAGDLGYTTGPSIFSEAASGKVLRTGWYFSVWKHDAYGWRVAADIGIQAPAAGPLRPRTVEFPSTPVVRTAARSRDDVLAVERELAAAMAKDGAAKAYRRYLGPASRLYRDGVAPVIGTGDIDSFLDGQPKPVGCRTVEAGVSKSGDLAYTVGECDAAPASGTAPAKTGFLRAWRGVPGGWLLAADVVTR